MTFLHFFGFTGITRFGERLRSDQYSVVSFLFTVLLKLPPFVKVEARAPVPHGVGATGH